MEEDQGHMTERLINFTLEIICLLTGEDYKVVKKTSGELLTPSSHLHGPSPITGPPLHSLTSDRKEKKILDVIRKMTELLTGEEWPFLEGQKDMMDNQPPLTSPDGTSNRDPPERCTGPLYSRDCTQEDPTIPHHYQDEANIQVKEEETAVSIEQATEQWGGVMRTIKEEETCVTIDQQSMEDARMMGTVKMEEGADVRSDLLSTQEAVVNAMSTDSDTDVSSTENPPEECSGPLYSQNWAQEDSTILYHYQDEANIQVKEEETAVSIDQQATEQWGGVMRTIKEEETCVTIDQQSMEDARMVGSVKMEEGADVRSDVNGMCLPNNTGPFNAQNGTWKDPAHPHQEEEKMHVKAEVKEEETCVTIDQQSMEDARMMGTVKTEDGKTQPGPSSTSQEPPPKKTREQLVEELHAKMRRMNGQDQPPTDSFPENPKRDPSKPYESDDWDRHKMGHTDWCSCHNCTTMPTGQESICCREIANITAHMDNIPCITDHAMFSQLCLDMELAKIFLFLITKCKGFKPTKKKRNRIPLTRKSLRRAVYSAFTGWVHRYLGQDDRRPIPSCVVMKVRAAFPEVKKKKPNRFGIRPMGDYSAEAMVWDSS